MTRKAATATVPYLVLLAEVVVFFRRVLFNPSFSIPWDFRYFHVPNATFVADSLAAGRFPLWDPYTYCGRPFFADIQMQAFYPPLLLTALVSNLTGHLRYLLQLDLIAHILFAGITAYWLLRRLGTGMPAALAGATVFQAGGFFASQTQHLVHTNAAAWMPLAWLAVVDMREGVRLGPMAILAVATGMSFLAGYPPVTIVIAGSCVLLALLLGGGGKQLSLRVTAGVTGARLGAVVASIGFGLLLAGIQFFPSLQLNAMSIGKYRTDFLRTGGGLPLASLVSLVAPNHYGIFDLATYRAPYELTFLYLYCSRLGLALAVAAVALVRSWTGRAFSLLALLTAVWMLGDSTPVFATLFPLLPRVLRNALHPEYAMAAFCLSIAVLAALGSERLLKRPVFAWAVVAVIAIDLMAVGSNRPMNLASVRAEPEVGRDQFEGSRELLATVRQLVNRSVPPARIDTVDASMRWAQTAHLTHVPTANGNDPQALEAIMQFRLRFCKGERWGAYYQVADPHSPALDALNIRYLLSRRPITGMPQVATIAGTGIYENTGATPRFCLAGTVVNGITTCGPGEVRVVRYENAALAVDAEAPAPSLLITSEPHYPGWRATIDGSETSIRVVNGAFRGIEVPAGRHRVEMRFAPAILWWSGAVSAAAWLLLAGAVLRSRAQIFHKQPEVTIRIRRA